jgi:hypothetical protein
MILTAEHIRVAGVVRRVTGMRWEEAHLVADALLNEFEMTERLASGEARKNWRPRGGRPVLTLVPKEMPS